MVVKRTEAKKGFVLLPRRWVAGTLIRSSAMLRQRVSLHLRFGLLRTACYVYCCFTRRLLCAVGEVPFIRSTRPAADGPAMPVTGDSILVFAGPVNFELGPLLPGDY